MLESGVLCSACDNVFVYSHMDNYICMVYNEVAIDGCHRSEPDKPTARLSCVHFALVRVALWVR